MSRKPGRVPTIRQVQEFFYQRGISAVESWQFYNYYDLKSWYGYRRKPLVRWELAAARWIEMIKSRYPGLVQPDEKTAVPPPSTGHPGPKGQPIVLCILSGDQALDFIRQLI